METIRQHLLGGGFLWQLLLLLLLLLLLDSSSSSVKVVTASFAYAPNFITKIVQEQTGITPAPGALLLQVVEPQHDQQQQQQHADEQQGDEPENAKKSTTAMISASRTTTTTTTTTLPRRVQIVRTRFPPEPNGYLHLGHAKAVCFNFAVARMFGGVCHMRMDDTNPSKEDEEYVMSILDDVVWIQQGLFDENNNSKSDSDSSNVSGVPWDGPVRKTSDYFDIIYHCALALIQSGNAYVDSLSVNEMKEYRGTLTEPGRESPDRNHRSIAENLQLFTDMRNGKYPEGALVLRAKIDMTSPNLNLRDPVLYRIKHESHQETGNTWCIYPMYDFSHPIADAVEGITHSLCTLEFEDHRPLYDWTLQKLWPTGLLLLPTTTTTTTEDNAELEVKRRHTHEQPPQQIEFSRLIVKSTVLSKRKLIQLAEISDTEKEPYVSGWDDPRMPTLCGLRRRGIPPAALRLFCERVGISKADSNIDYTVLEDCVRETMDASCPRAFCILEPLRVTIVNWNKDDDDDEKLLENFNVPRHPKMEEMGQRTIPFGKQLFIERSDFFDADGPEGQATGGKPPRGFKRLLPHGKDGDSAGGRVRLRYAYVVECQEVVRDPATKEPMELKCTFLPDTRAGVTPDGMARVDGIIHWVEASTAVKCRVNQYDRLFITEEPGKESGDFLQDINPASLQLLDKAVVEPSVAEEAVQLLEKIGENKKSRIYPSSLAYQFERSGYFALEKESTGRDNLVFNRVVTLRDTWGVSSKEQQGSSSSSSVGEGPQKTADQQPLEDIRRVAFRAGTILSASPHPEADSLLVCKVDCGDVSEPGNDNEPGQPRTIVAGLAGKIPIEDLVGRKVVTVTNLKPAKMRGIESTAMLLAASNGGQGDEEHVELLDVPDSVPNGELVSFEGKEPSQPDTLLKSKGALKAWERVKACLRSNSEGEATYKSDDDSIHRMITSGGPVKTASLKEAVIQ